MFQEQGDEEILLEKRTYMSYSWRILSLVYANVDSTEDKILMVYGQSWDRATLCCMLNELLSKEWRLVDWYFLCVCLSKTLEDFDVSILICNLQFV